MEKNSKIYVAGHRGLVGSAIVRGLKAKGYTIRDFIKIEYSTMVPDDNNYYVKYNNTANIEKGGENKGESKKDVDAIKPIVTKDRK